MGKIYTSYALLCHLHSLFQLLCYHQDLEQALHLQQQPLSLSQILYKKTDVANVEMLKYSQTIKFVKVYKSLYTLLNQEKWKISKYRVEDLHQIFSNIDQVAECVYLPESFLWINTISKAYQS